LAVAVTTTLRGALFSSASSHAPNGARSRFMRTESKQLLLRELLVNQHLAGRSQCYQVKRLSCLGQCQRTADLI
jgi:hypothetical protein